MEKKIMLTNSELINHMESKNITFDKMSKSDALYLLNNKNYYFKVASYRVNFSKDSNGKYNNLDFAYLSDLAVIDMHLRNYLLSLCLDIEHGIKLRLINYISNDIDEDGYSIVNDFKEKYPSQFNQTLLYLKKNKYLNDMYEKYKENTPIWVFLETTTFGNLSMFVEFYNKRKKVKSINQISHHLKYCKNIRNACAHNTPLLVNLFSDKEFLSRPSAAVMSIATTMNIPNNQVHDLKINDLISTFYLHKKIQSKKMGEHKFEEGNALINRFNLNSEWYSDNPKLTTFLSILQKLVDYLNE